MAGYRNSIPTDADPDNNQDNDDNGLETVNGNVNPIVGYVASEAITLNGGTEPSRTTATGDSNWTVDFGFYKLELGDRVWIDSDRNGVDNGEPGLAGVLITATNLSTGEIFTTTTDNNGNYLFTNLSAGNYQVTMAMPNGYVSTSPDSATPVSADKDDDGVGVSSGEIEKLVFPLTPGVTVDGVQTVDVATGATVNPSIDFGLVLPADWVTLPLTTIHSMPMVARSMIVAGLNMGAIVDGEGNGQPDAGAEGDDAMDTPDDEDGVLFPPLYAGQVAPIVVDHAQHGYQ